MLTVANAAAVLREDGHLICSVLSVMLCHVDCCGCCCSSYRKQTHDLFCPFSDAVQCGLLPVLLQFLQKTDTSPEVLCEVAWVLTNLTNRYTLICIMFVVYLMCKNRFKWDVWVVSLNLPDMLIGIVCGELQCI